MAKKIRNKDHSILKAIIKSVFQVFLVFFTCIKPAPSQDFGQIRSKTCSFIRLFITPCHPDFQTFCQTCLNLGAVHKQRRQFFRISDTPLPYISSFLVLSLDIFDQFLTPPSCRRRLWTAPQMFRGKITNRKLALTDK